MVMAVRLPDTWLHGLLDAQTPVRPTRRHLAAAHGDHSFVTQHLHTTGLLYGLPDRVPGAHPAETATLHAVATHLLAVPAAVVALNAPGLPQEGVRVVTAAAVALRMRALDTAVGLLHLPQGAQERTQARLLEKLGRVWGTALWTTTSPALPHAHKAALWSAEAALLASAARRILRNGVVLDRNRVDRLHVRLERSRTRLLQGVTALGLPPVATPLRKALLNAGLSRAQLKTVDQAAPTLLGDARVRRLMTAVLLDHILRGEGLDLDQATRWSISTVRLRRLNRRAEEARKVHGLSIQSAAPAHPAHAEVMASQVAAWTQRVVLKNLDRLILEIRETGELAALLAKAGSGTDLTAEEWRKVREQLLDVVKAIPSLAVFALPGGALLLPILLKVLPFDLRPSSFRDGPPQPNAPHKPRTTEPTS